MNRIAVTVTLLSLNFAIGAIAADQVAESNQTTTPNGSWKPAATLHAVESLKITSTVTGEAVGRKAQIEDLQPFTHLARIPADFDTSTIRFEGAKTVAVGTRITSTTDPKYCAELAFRDPGGSMYCPFTRTGSPAMAYEVTYSYVGQPMASDESGNRRFTFQVYFRPEELAPEVRQAVDAKKWNRADTAAYFTVSTDRELVRRVAIDEARSRLCAGNYMDGLWTHSDANCTDEVNYETIAVPSDFVTVRVDPVSARDRLAANTAGRPSSGGK